MEWLRQAILAYIDSMTKSWNSSRSINICDVKGLVKLTGNNFGVVQQTLVSRLMHKEEKTSASAAQWVPDYHGRHHEVWRPETTGRPVPKNHYRGRFQGLSNAA